MAKRRGHEPTPIAPKLARLSILEHSPAEQRAFAVELVANETDFRLIQAGLDVLVPTSDPEIARLLIERYADFDDPKRDQGGTVRAAITRALRHVRAEGLVAVYERAIATYERTLQGVGGDLRAAGLIGLRQEAPGSAKFHAVRFLNDPELARDDWWEAGGEPGVTSVRVLAELGEDLVLFYVGLDHWQPDTRGEAVRLLENLPPDLAPALVEAILPRRGEPAPLTVVLGLMDLSIAHPGAEALRNFLRQQLGTELDDDVYSYLVSAIVASHRADHQALLLERAPQERKEARRTMLRDALSLVRREPGVDDALQALQTKPSATRRVGE